MTEVARQAERVWYLLLSAACLLIIISGAVTAAAVAPQFCGTCHGNEVKALAQSRHAGTSCDKCHTDSSFAGVLDNRLDVVGMLPAKLLFGQDALGGDVNSDRCIACHKDILRKTITARGLRMNHRAVQEQKWECTNCHPKVAHRKAGQVATGYSMDMCLQCHTPTTKDLQLCSICHIQQQPGGQRNRAEQMTPWRATHGSNWRQAHGMGNLQTCQSCHAESFCVACHKMTLPHPPSFRAEHGRFVLSRANRAADCFVCHKKATCENCHGVPMPHQQEFIKKHSAVVKQYGSAVCVRCHEKKSCDSCHVSHVHPGIPQDVLRKLQENPAK